MMNETGNVATRHVGAMLSGFVDGELTQQQRQLVALHCEACAQCREELDHLRELRARVRNANLSEVGEDKWRETMDDSAVKVTRGIGWLIFIAGLLVISGVGVFTFLFKDDAPLWVKLVMVGIYGGLALLFVSVLRQRVIESRTDKYKDVEI